MYTGTLSILIYLINELSHVASNSSSRAHWIHSTTLVSWKVNGNSNRVLSLYSLTLFAKLKVVYVRINKTILAFVTVDKIFNG